VRLVRALPFVLPVLLLILLTVWAPRVGYAQPDVSASTGTVRSAHAVVSFGPGTAASRAHTIAAEIDRLAKGIGGDLRDTPPVLQVHLYATHAAFATALYALQHARPQSSMDDTSEVVNNTLLLGPINPPYLQHNVAHVYTEWILDRLTGNRLAVLPSTPWLYDGLAEYEAYRYAPAGMRCSVKAPTVLDITDVRTAQQWLSIRAGPLGDLEYCLAYVQTRALVARVGWSSVVRLLHQGWTWNVVARHLLTAKPPA
jgi:hypothetical protein